MIFCFTNLYRRIDTLGPRRINQCGALVCVLLLALIVSGLIFFHDNQLVLRAIRLILIPCLGFFFAVPAFYFQKKWLLSRSKTVRLILYAAVTYCVVFISLKLKKLWSFHYEAFDTGVYVNKLFRIWNHDVIDAITFSLTSGHFSPALLVFSALFSFSSPVELLLIIQTLSIASSVVPLFLIIRNYLSEKSTLFICLAWLFNPLLHFNDILGFVPDHLVIPVFLWCFYFLERAFLYRCTIALATISLVSEIWIPSCIAFGLYAFLGTDHKRYGLMVITFFTMFFAFVLALLAWANSPNSLMGLFVTISSSDQEMFSAIDKTQPSLNFRKCHYLFFLFGPFLFLPLLSWRILIVAVPDLLRNLGSSELLHFSLEGHYTGALVVVATFATFSTLVRINHQSTGHPISFFDKEFISVALLTTTVFFNIGHGVTPLSLNFWNHWSGGAFHWDRYVSSNREQSFEEIHAIIANYEDPRIEITNEIFSPELFQVKNEIKIFPSQDWEASDILVIDANQEGNSGANLEKDLYIKRSAEALKVVKENFDLQYESDQIFVWTAKQR